MAKQDITRRGAFKLAGGAVAAALTINKGFAVALPEPPSLMALQKLEALQAALADRAPLVPSGFVEVFLRVRRIHDEARMPFFTPCHYRLMFRLIAHECREGTASDKAELATVYEAAASKDYEKEEVDFLLDALRNQRVFNRNCSARSLQKSYRRFVLKRCRQVGLHVSETDRKLIAIWCGGADTARAVVAGCRLLGKEQSSTT